MPESNQSLSDRQLKLLHLALQYKDLSDKLLQIERNEAILAVSEIEGLLKIDRRTLQSILFDLSRRHLAHVTPEGYLSLTLKGVDAIYGVMERELAQNKQQEELHLQYEKFYAGKLYKIRDYVDGDVETLSFKHRLQMTKENLHSKGDIADELGYRDYVISQQAKLINALKCKIGGYVDLNLKIDLEGNQGSDRRNVEYGSYCGRVSLANELDVILRDPIHKLSPTPTYDELKKGI
jgi:hypothetical protein